MTVTLKKNSLHDLVRRALIAARQNGYNFNDWSDRDVAIDLNRHVAEFNNTPHGELLSAVTACRSGVFPKLSAQSPSRKMYPGDDGTDAISSVILVFWPVLRPISIQIRLDQSPLRRSDIAPPGFHMMHLRPRTLPLIAKEHAHVSAG